MAISNDHLEKSHYTMKKAEENATKKPYKDADTVNSIITNPTSEDDYSDATTINDCLILALTDDEHLWTLKTTAKQCLTPTSKKTLRLQILVHPYVHSTNDAETLKLVEQQSLHVGNLIRLKHFVAVSSSNSHTYTAIAL
jgi:hypothetical protein